MYTLDSLIAALEALRARHGTRSGDMPVRVNDGDGLYMFGLTVELDEETGDPFVQFDTTAAVEPVPVDE